MSDTNGRARPAKGISPRRNTGLDSVKKKLPFPARLACFWPLAVVPGLMLSLLLGQAIPGVALAYVCNSLLTVLFYREDKRLAEQQNWRIPEYYLQPFVDRDTVPFAGLKAPNREKLAEYAKILASVAEKVRIRG